MANNPQSEQESSGEKETLRDRFAMAALTGLLSGGARAGSNVAWQAYKYADYMLQARSETPEPGE
jgi:hypothetical protein